MTDYKPGTVAVATVDGKPNVRVMRYDTGCERGWIATDIGRIWYDGNEVTDVRPLVVLDPDDAASVEQLADDYHDCDGAVLDNVQPMSVRGLAMRAALLARTRPPKPAEPTGLGAVVEDAEGTLWTRFTREYDYDAVWSHETSHRGNCAWSDVTAVRILSDGVTA